MRGMELRGVLAAAACLVVLAGCQPVSPEVRTASAPVPDFVQAVCGDCHAVEAPFLSPDPQAPTFADIANQQGLTAQSLSAWLRDAHNYPEAMEFYLDEARADELAAYIVTLRNPDYEPQI